MDQVKLTLKNFIALILLLLFVVNFISKCFDIRDFLQVFNLPLPVPSGYPISGHIGKMAMFVGVVRQFA